MANRRAGFTASAAPADAGTMLSSTGNPIVTPSPRSTARLEMAFFVRNILFSPPEAHLKWGAGGDPQDDGRPAIVVGGSTFHGASHRRHVVRLDPSTQRIREQLFAHRLHEQRLPRFHQLPQSVRPVQFGSVWQRSAAIDRA